MSEEKKQVAVIILPTYNEALNIDKMIDEFCIRIFPSIKNWSMKILVVDGNSTDGTGDIVRKKVSQFDNVYLFLENSKNGLGAAYLAGFRVAIQELKVDLVFEFDADFQHPLDSVPIMINKIDSGFDYVIGSRKIEGGGETTDRNIWRSFLTNVGSFVARFILFFPSGNFSKVTDPTSGLRATRVKGFADKLSLDPEHLFSKKFGYKLQLLYETLKLGARYGEIPLQFQNRIAGKSKFEAGTIWEILITCFKTRFVGK